MNAKTSGFGGGLTADMLNARGAGHLPGLVGLRVLSLAREGLESRLEIRKELLAPNGYLHAAAVIALADTSCGYACVANLPQGASGFTTLELKANFLGTALEGAMMLRHHAAPTLPDFSVAFLVVCAISLTAFFWNRQFHPSDGVEFSGHTPRTWSLRQALKDMRGLNP